jgi:Mg-chelatase subunit ChlI
MKAEIINLHSTAAAALIVESRVARIRAKIAMGDFAAAIADIDGLRNLPFGDGVSAFIRSEARRHADCLSASMMRARQPEPTGAA